MKKFLLFFIATISFATLFAQYNLQNGSYIFNTWNANEAAGTYPDNMLFYFLNTTTDPNSSNEIADIYDLPYNLTSSSRIRGLGSDGFSMVNTATSNHHPNGQQLGAFIIQLNTSNRTDIQLEWTAKTIQKGGRDYIFQVFYRIGNSGSWLEAVDNNNEPVLYLTESVNGAETSMPTWYLPSILEDQSHIELLWKFYESPNSSQTGARAQLAIKSIEIHSSGPFDPQFTWQKYQDYSIEQKGINHIDSLQLSFNDLGENITLSSSYPFEISFDPNSGFQNNLNYLFNNISEDSFKIFIRNTDPIPSWQTAVIQANSSQVVNSFSYDWYYSNTRLPEILQLQDESYIFSEWPSDTLSETYPPFMSFQVFQGANYDNTELPLANDWKCSYNLTSRSRFTGLNDWGIEIRNTASPQWDNCNSQGEDLQQFPGAVTLVVNTENVDSALLQYYVMMYDQANVTHPRKYKLKLQFRTNNNSHFKDFSLESQHPAYDVLNYDEHFMKLRIPDSLLEKKYLEFRWIYYDEEPGYGTGTRPAYRLDEIGIINLAFAKDEDDDSAINIEELEKEKFTVFPNPILSGKELRFSKYFNGILMDKYGRVILSIKNKKSIYIPFLSAGVYYLKSHTGQVKKLIIL
ncbi:MAG TPA: hypothetical protein VK027_09915 [Chitinophagaceae bacterium]|nr:hypothetical protein [Chitinophagaceae bacterium]